ncbi:MAG: exonuclease SbcC [Thaumarchaeota archaeon]|nr:exonuclease SbcC [Nitrososphaerota archaeon]
MVFGRGEKKEEKQRTKTTRIRKEISLSEVNKIIEDFKTIREKTLITETKSIKNKIVSNLGDLLKISKTLEKDNLKVDDIDKHLKILVLRGKSQLISIIKNEVIWIFNEINSYDDVLKFDKQISQILKKIGDVLGRQSRVIHIFAKKYANKLKNTLSSIDSSVKGLHIILENHRKLNENIISISNDFLGINQIKEEQEKRKERVNKLTESINSQKTVIKSRNDDIEILKASNEYSEFLNIKSDIEKLDPEKKQIKNDIDLQFTKISRPLGKYSYISSLDKPQKNLMEKLIKNPFEVLNQENKADIITILESTRKGVEAGSVSVKDTTKSLIQLDETIKILDNFINNISEFNSKRAKLEDSLKIFNSKDLDHRESELVRALNEKNDLEERIQNIDNEISQNKKEIPRLILEIESKLGKVSATQYTIVQ